MGHTNVGQNVSGQVDANPIGLVVGLIGAGIGASKSPMLHMREALAQGFALDYRLIDLNLRGLGVAALPDLLDEVQAAGFAGVNITHPCKQAVIAHLDALSDDAAMLGAVNTVVFAPDGRRIGHNTDWSGFMQGFRAQAPEADLRHVVQLGAGGAGVAVAHALWRMGAERLGLHDPDQAKGAALVAALNSRAGRDFAYQIDDVEGAMAKASALVHCTPVGMADHPGLPLDIACLRPDHVVADIVYFPLETALLQAARQIGCRIIDGGGMAVFQAVDAFRLFTGREADGARMTACFRAAVA